MFSKVGKVFVATDNIINGYTLGHRQEIQILNITDMRLRLDCDVCKMTNIIDHFEEAETRFHGNQIVELWTSNDSTNLFQQLLTDIYLNILAIKHICQR